jgi:hypothetical protein
VERSSSNDVQWIQRFIESAETRTPDRKSRRVPTLILDQFAAGTETPNTFFVSLSGVLIYRGNNQALAARTVIEYCSANVSDDIRDQLSKVTELGVLNTFDGTKVSASDGEWRFAVAVAAYFCPTISCSVYSQNERHLP